MYVVGVDPGLRSGAYASINQHGAWQACGDIPAIGDRIDVIQLREALRLAVPPGEVAHIVIEDVWVMPKQGSVSSAGFMRAAGAIEAVAALTGWVVTMVRPQVWKKHCGLIGANKSGDLALARQMWPDAPLKLAKSHGIADSLLIAQWGLDTLA